MLVRSLPFDHEFMHETCWRWVYLQSYTQWRCHL